MYIKYAFLASTILLTSCTLGQVSQPVLPPTPIVKPPVVQPLPATTETVTTGEKETKSYTLKLVNNQGSLKINHGTGSRLAVHFTSEANKTLHLTLKTPGDALGNTRITQIVLPNGEMDGPFGRNMIRKLTSSGEYQVIIGENMMAGDPWSGEVDLAISLK